MIECSTTVPESAYENSQIAIMSLMLTQTLRMGVLKATCTSCMVFAECEITNIHKLMQCLLVCAVQAHILLKPYLK